MGFNDAMQWLAIAALAVIVLIEHNARDAN